MKVSTFLGLHLAHLGFLGRPVDVLLKRSGTLPIHSFSPRKEHPTRQRLYGTLPTLSSTIRERRLRFAGHRGRTKEELVSSELLWTPKHGYTKVGRPSKTYIQQLAQDAGCETEELKSLMQDHDQRRERVRLVRASRPTG